MPENRKHTPEHDESWVIICDALLGRLMRSMFQGRRYLQLDAEEMTGRLDAYRKIRNGDWVQNTYARPLTMQAVLQITVAGRQNHLHRISSLSLNT